MNDIPYLILGAGGHASVLTDILLSQGAQIAGVVAPTVNSRTGIFDQLEHFVSDDDVLSFSPKEILLVNGIGSLPGKQLRTVIYNRFKDDGYTFATVIADKTAVSEYATLEEGVQILANAAVNVGTHIGANTIINTSASIDHDCEIGRHCHIAPGSTLSGHVIVKDSVHLATGTSVTNNVTIGSGSVIGVGANVAQTINSDSTVYGARGVIKGA